MKDTWLYFVFSLIQIIELIGLSNELNCSNEYISDGINCNEECGLTDVVPNVKIVGGVVANPHSWPSHALIVRSYRGNHTVNGTSLFISKNFICGGTVINSYTILTAAHCCKNSFQYSTNTSTYNITMYFTDNPYHLMFESTFKVYLGAHNISFLSTNSSPSLPTVEYKVANIILHPFYSIESGLNDIALLILNDKITFNSYIKTACLPLYSTTYPSTTNVTAYATGWGTLAYGGPKTTLLNNVNLTIYNISYCTSVFPEAEKNPDLQICAGELAGGKDTCQGDTGGGMYILDTFGGKSRYMVVGITSYGDECAKVNFPAVYTRTSYYTNWIKSNWKESKFENSTTYQATDASIIAITVGTIIGVIIVSVVIVFMIIAYKIMIKKKSNLITPT